MLWLSKTKVTSSGGKLRLLFFHLLEYDFYLIKQTRVDSDNKSHRDALFLKFIMIKNSSLSK
jgi:hypothetical protein